MNDTGLVVAIKNVKKSFGNNVVLDGINLDVSKGEVVVICGRSGSGKSTFLEHSTEKYDYKRGFTTLSVNVVIPMNNLLENAYWISSGWEVSVKTDNGVLTLD